MRHLTRQSRLHVNSLGGRESQATLADEEKFRTDFANGREERFCRGEEKGLLSNCNEMLTLST